MNNSKNFEVVTPASVGIDETKYDAMAKCLNCGNEWDINIPKGTLVSEWLGNKKIDNRCRNCMCPDARIVGRATA